MTTILHVRNEGMYGDRRSYQGFEDTLIPIADNPKIYNLAGLWVIGYSGLLHNDERYRFKLAETINKHINDGHHTYPSDMYYPPNIILHRINEKDTWYIDCKNNTVDIVEITNEPYFAIGSGSGYASAIMRLSGNPQDAIKEASDLDTQTGNEFDYIDYKDVESKRELIPDEILEKIMAGGITC